MKNIIENLDLGAEGIWFPMLFGTLALLYMLFMPKKRISWREIYFTFGLIGFVTWALDVTFLATYLDMFDLGDDPKSTGIGDFMALAIVPPCLAVIYLNYYRQEKRWMYVVFFTLLSLLFEWGLVQLNFMKLYGWQTWWSIPVYILVYAFWLPWHLRLLRKSS
jgi:hypothetical protein